MNEDEIDISSSSSSSSSANSSRSNSPTRKRRFSHKDRIELNLIDDQELVDLDGDFPIPASVHQQIIKTAGEIDLDELPSVEPVNFKASLQDLDQIGRISSITGKLVVVLSFKNKPPLDLDSVLFLRDCLPLGKIFDTFGPVVSPYYAIRFNSVEEINSRGVKIGSPVYFVPHLPAPLTRFVFYKDLEKMKGSDASWQHDNEPPEELLDYSDDEEERLAKINRKRKSAKPVGSSKTDEVSNNPDEEEKPQIISSGLESEGSTEESQKRPALHESVPVQNSLETKPEDGVNVTLEKKELITNEIANMHL